MAGGARHARLCQIFLRGSAYRLDRDRVVLTTRQAERALPDQCLHLVAGAAFRLAVGDGGPASPFGGRAVDRDNDCKTGRNRSRNRDPQSGTSIETRLGSGEEELNHPAVAYVKTLCTPVYLWPDP